MLKYLLAAALVGMSASSSEVNSFGRDGKTVRISPPQPFQEPSQQPAIAKPSASEVVGHSQSYVTVDRAVIYVPRAGEQVVDVPYSPIHLPHGEVTEQVVDYNIPQPAIEVPGPSVQSKPVVFNVPQQAIHVPEPVIRPIVYPVPYSLSLQKPVVNHQPIFYRFRFYQVHAASFQPKNSTPHIHIPEPPMFEANAF